MKSDNTSRILAKYTSEAIIEAAQAIFFNRINNSQAFTDPRDVKKFLTFKIGHEEREHFSVMFLDTQNRLIRFETLFSGTINQTSIYPREIVKKALELNAAALILCHNHPSGALEASQADIVLTKAVKSACTMLDIRILDHIIVSVQGASSMAELGLI